MCSSSYIRVPTPLTEGANSLSDAILDYVVGLDSFVVGVVLGAIFGRVFVGRCVPLAVCVPASGTP